MALSEDLVAKILDTIQIVSRGGSEGAKVSSVERLEVPLKEVLEEIVSPEENNKKIAPAPPLSPFNTFENVMKFRKDQVEKGKGVEMPDSFDDKLEKEHTDDDIWNESMGELK